jgi:cobalt-zinc-cadmium efflux system outer membrane protein
MKGTIVLLLFCLFASGKIKAQTKNNILLQDTIRLTLLEAEKQFIDSNYLVLAAHYNVDAQKAQIIQAKLLPNPNLSYTRGPLIPLHDDQSNIVNSNFLNNAENAATLSQLIQVAGKRNKQIKIAEANTQLAELQLFDLIRTLKYTLRTDFYNIYYLQQSAHVYNKEIQSLQQVVSAFNQQQGKGYISEKEVVRVKALLYNLQSEYNDLINQINDTESELRTILRIKKNYIVPLTDEDKLNKLTPTKFSLSILIDTAYANRTDLLIAKKNTEINKLNYNLQKAISKPDITAYASYDKQGSYAQHFNAIGISMDLPFFNRNQGNIKTAKSLIDASTAATKATEATVEEQIFRALQKAIDNQKLYEQIDSRFIADFDRLQKEVFANYQKRNIGLLDFLDFYDSYKQNVLQLNNIQFNRISAFEDLNFYTGTNIY